MKESPDPELKKRAAPGSKKILFEDGNYKKVSGGGIDGGGSSDAASKVAYITMMQVRAYIIHSSNEALAMACTIASH